MKNKGILLLVLILIVSGTLTSSDKKLDFAVSKLMIEYSCNGEQFEYASDKMTIGGKQFHEYQDNIRNNLKAMQGKNYDLVDLIAKQKSCARDAIAVNRIYVHETHCFKDGSSSCHIRELNNGEIELKQLQSLVEEKQVASRKFNFQNAVNNFLQDTEEDTLDSETNKPDIKVDIGDGVMLEMVWIGRGSFKMGSASKFCGSEEPVHLIVISKGFYMGKYEVTKKQWTTLIKDDTYLEGHENEPKGRLSWNDCQEFIQKLNQKTGEKFRLPTEAEWEYACRAGSETEYYWGEELDENYLWHQGNSEGEKCEVGKKKPNNWGLYDMSGNVWEYCQDWFSYSYYNNSPNHDPKGPEDGQFRVSRGGSKSNYNGDCRSASRNYTQPEEKKIAIGFRLVMD